MINQCDGCAAKMPIAQEIYHMNYESTELWTQIHMICCKDDYNTEENKDED